MSAPYNVSKLVISNGTQVTLKISLRPLGIGPIIDLNLSVAPGQLNVVSDLTKVPGIPDHIRFQVQARVESGPSEIIDRTVFTYERSSVLAGIVNYGLPPA
ncbi:hypothetical protein GYMLUDRAFT_246839 [Collybiopsis luxurians FD-317 M1]|uniref:Unplaced genomic scaffold GYMLUscaffold_42, whole genome shotgun sequence n=1 Tax=Collybiopsis luxurians FD-317 M1 TaxID=944289 RepID=A0A0D0CH28_9AGAR|nr:hypothetical protein GYMLUDRAFT_246839 [Collybiopsis luxurians FD-317 M1]